MKWLVALVGASLLAGLIVWLFGGGRYDGPYINDPPTPTGPWVAFGDSLTEGYGAGRDEAYPAVFSRLTGIPVKNLGVSGDTSQDGLNRVEEAAKLMPRVVLLCLGGNDTLRQIPRETTFANLEKLIDRFHREGSFVVLIGVRSASLLRDKNDEWFEKLAERKKVLLLDDILDGVMFNRALMSDQLHPNAKGYAQIAERFAAELGPLLSRLRGI
jgi:acyl-CoA thioesterase-1